MNTSKPSIMRKNTSSFLHIRLFHSLFLSLFILLSIACSNNDDDPEEQNNTCYACTYINNIPEICGDNFFFEACIIGNRPNSAQVIMEIKEVCGTNIQTSQRTGFLEEFLEEQAAQGGDCQKI